MPARCVACRDEEVGDGASGSRWPPKLPATTASIRRVTGQKKTADPRLGTSGVKLVVPPHFAIPVRERPHPARPKGRCSGSITGADGSVWTSRRRLLNRTRGRSFGAELRGLIRWRFRSRFAATAVLLPIPARDVSSSSLQSSIVIATVAIATATVNPLPAASFAGRQLRVTRSYGDRLAPGSPGIARRQSCRRLCGGCGSGGSREREVERAGTNPAGEEVE